MKNAVFILGVRIDDLAEEKIDEKLKYFLNSKNAHLIFTPNPEICLKAEKDEAYRKVLNDSALNIPDGIGLKLGAKILGQKLVNRLTGVDLTLKLLKFAEQENYSVYFLGGKEGIAALAAKKVKEKYPGVKIFSNQGFPDKSFKSLIGARLIYDQKINEEVIADINCQKPDILIVAFGAPKQEIWLTENIDKLKSVKIAVGVGGTLDYLSGKVKRAPKWWRNLGLEWFYRLLKQPWRYKRIIDATIKFPLTCYKWKKRIENDFRPNVLGVIKKDGKYLIQENLRLGKNHWQFPQGGINEKEKPETAVIREISEELGAPEKFFKIIKKLPVEHYYIWPRWAQLLRGYKGQHQQFFLLRFLGQDKDFDISKSDEVSAIKWVEKDNLLKWLHPNRQESLKKILDYI